jgi:drug/metabolite transporter (DMT)-like permease
MALVGSYVGLSKLLVGVFPVFLLAWLRFGIAAVAMLGWLRRAPGDPPLSPRDRKLLFWESFLGNFLFSIFMLFGVALTSALAAGVIMAAIPAAVALLSWLALGERIARRVALGIACAMACFR